MVRKEIALILFSFASNARGWSLANRPVSRVIKHERHMRLPIRRISLKNESSGEAMNHRHQSRLRVPLKPGFRVVLKLMIAYAIHRLVLSPALSVVIESDSVVAAGMGSAEVIKASALVASPATTQGCETTLKAVSVISPINWLTELRLTARLVYASIVGAAVGKERSAKNRHAAGIRTMALVSLGAATFTICSAFGFHSGDPSRMASNVASGVGFVGAGVITTTTSKLDDRKENFVHGLTTAAAIWLSAAVGVASGLGMYLVAGVAAASTIAILRVGVVTETLQNRREWILSSKHEKGSTKSRRHQTSDEPRRERRTGSPHGSQSSKDVASHRSDFEEKKVTKRTSGGGNETDTISS